MLLERSSPSRLFLCVRRPSFLRQTEVEGGVCSPPGVPAPRGVYVALSLTTCAVWHLALVLTIARVRVTDRPAGPGADHAARAGSRAVPTLPGYSGSLGAAASVAQVQLPTSDGTGPFILCLSQSARLKSPRQMPSVPGKLTPSPRRWGVLRLLPA